MIPSETHFKKSIVTTVSNRIVARRNKGLGSGWESMRGHGQGQEQSGSRDKREMSALAVYFENRTKRKGSLMNFLSNEGKKKKSKMSPGFHFVLLEPLSTGPVWSTELETTCGRTSWDGENPEFNFGYLQFESLLNIQGKRRRMSSSGVCIEEHQDWKYHSKRNQCMDCLYIREAGEDSLAGWRLRQRGGAQAEPWGTPGCLGEGEVRKSNQGGLQEENQASVGAVSRVWSLRSQAAEGQVGK